MNLLGVVSRLILCCSLVWAAGNTAVVVDRIAVIVGKRVIKTSDIDTDQRLTAFLNREPVGTDSESRRQSAERLIEQEIIRQEIISGGYRRPAEGQAAALESQLTRDRFSGSGARLREELTRYGLSENDLREQLLWQLTVLEFIDQRFQGGAAISDDEIRAYYNQHLADLRRQNPQGSNYEAVAPQIRKILEGERVDQDFNRWLGEARKRYRIEYKQEALK